MKFLLKLVQFGHKYELLVKDNNEIPTIVGILPRRKEAGVKDNNKIPTIVGMNQAKAPYVQVKDNNEIPTIVGLSCLHDSARVKDNNEIPTIVGIFAQIVISKCQR